MSRGYFTIAQGEQYHRLAYALALSLKLSQSGPSDLSVGVTKDEIKSIPSKYKQVFDNVIEIPWEDHAKTSSWKLENEWKAIYMTPYDETIKLDADMIFPTDVSHWWDTLAESDGVFATQPRTYRDELITSDYCRKTFTESNLPNVYSAMFYFKKNDLNFEFFKLAEFIFNNWEKCFYEWLEPTHRPKFVSTDVVFALVAKILNYESYNKFPQEVPTFVHMKSQLQNWPDNQFLTDDWTKIIPYYFSKDCSLKVGNHVQHLPFHYQVKEFMTDKMIQTMEKKLGI